MNPLSEASSGGGGKKTPALEVPPGMNARGQELLPFALLLIVLPFPHTVAVRLLTLSAAFLIAAWYWWRFLPVRAPVPGKPAIAMWIAVSAASLAYAVDPAYSLREIKNEIGYTMMAFFAFYVIAADANRARYLLRALALGLTIIGGWAAMAWFAHGLHWDEGGGYGGSGVFATYLITVTPVLGWLMLEDESRLVRRISVGLLFFVLLLAFAAGQRAIWPALIVQILLFTYLLGRTGRLALGRPQWLAGLAILMVIGAIALDFQQQMRFGNTGDDSTHLLTDSRLSFWPEVVANIAQHPFSGGGFGIRAMAKAYPDLIPNDNQMLWHAHNVFLNYGIGMGLPGMLALAALFGYWGWFFWRTATTAPSQAILAGIAGLALVAGVVLRNQSNDFFARDMSLMFWALTGLFARLAVASRPGGHS